MWRGLSRWGEFWRHRGQSPAGIETLVPVQIGLSSPRAGLYFTELEGKTCSNLDEDRAGLIFISQ